MGEATVEPSHPHSQWKTRALKWLRVLSWEYFTLLFGWAIAHMIWGDSLWWLFMFNALAVWLFAPLPVIFLIACLVRKREVWVATGLVFLLGIVLFGRAYLPRMAAPALPGQAITVMTYNVMGFNDRPDQVVETILATQADIVTLHELNPTVAKAIRQTLRTEYPYQELDPQEKYSGSGVISRYPLVLAEERLPGTWLGAAYVFHATVAGKQVTVLQAHTPATGLGSIPYLEQTISNREEHARIIKDFVETHPGPLIAPIDFNSTTLNTSYRIVTTVLSDAWLEVGWGLGHTFPAGTHSPVSIPLVRIDYIFYSHHFQATDAWLGPWDGASDHHPVLARLVLRSD